ncbi:MAG: Rieske 2Fe-2S domain-containing protein [Rhodospirillaceae bacterium]|jgi:choline monooxygenase|nr:Rieske 2Fe-2S domain-containing protein [Rhodospirillaceae bacterium]
MDEALSRLISQAEHDLVMAPIERAMTLPDQAYASQDWFDLEIERIFRRRWMGVLFECMAPEAGDALPFDFLGMPLLALRGADGILRVFHNICPFDGCPAVLEPARGLDHVEVLYHGWRYDLAGRLTDASYWNGDPNCKATDIAAFDGDLVEVRSAVRQGVLLVNLDGAAEDADEWLAPWRRTVGEHFAIDALEPARDAEGRPLIEERIVAANWKTYQENASINILHEAFTHALYRKSPEVPRVDAARKPTFRNHIEGCMVAFSHSRADSGKTYDEIALPTAGHDPKKQPEYGFFSTIYPNLNVPLLDAFAKVNITIPVAPGVTKLMHLRFYRPEALASARFQEEERALQDAFDIVHAEDRVAIEAVQRGRASPVWRQHPYAPFWDALHHRFNALAMADMERPA